jgi:kynurenine formamidase
VVDDGGWVVRGAAVIATALALAGCSGPAVDNGAAPEAGEEQAAAPAAAPLAGEVIDLTHPFDEQTIYWPTEEGFVLERGPAGVTDAGFYYEAHRFRSAEHGGTHLDAPIHFAEGKWTADQIPVERLIGPGALVDVSAQAAADRDYQATAADLQAWEAEHGRLPDGAIVLLSTGFGAYWPDRERYMGTALRGAEGVAALHFPGLHPDAARWLVAERSISAIGLDTPSIDHGQSKLFESHQRLFAANVPAFENVAHLDRLPPAGFTVVALPMKIAGGSGGPLRIVAVLPASG